MITQSPTLLPKEGWQKALTNAINDPKELLAQLGLSGYLEAIDGDIIKNFPLRVPQSYINKMRHGDPFDPLLRQVFPLIDDCLLYTSPSPRDS